MLQYIGILIWKLAYFERFIILGVVISSLFRILQHVVYHYIKGVDYGTC